MILHSKVPLFHTNALTAVDLDDKNWDSVDDNDQDARKGVIRMSLMILVMSMTMSMNKMSTK